MRMLLSAKIPHETFNAAVRDGSAGRKLQQILDDTKPEAVYFYEDGGKRGGLMVVTLEKTSQIPAIAEPWFLAFNATISFRPVMNPQDLAAAGPSIAKAAKEYGK